MGTGLGSAFTLHDANLENKISDKKGGEGGNENLQLGTNTVRGIEREGGNNESKKRQTDKRETK